jgi:hypothetical protein
MSSVGVVGGIGVIDHRAAGAGLGPGVDQPLPDLIDGGRAVGEGVLLPFQRGSVIPGGRARSGLVVTGRGSSV